MQRNIIGGIRLLNICGINNEIHGKQKEDITININGDYNLIVIDDDAYVANVTIQINGSYNVLQLGKVIIKRGIFWYDSDNSKIIIGNDTSIENAGMVAAESNTEIMLGEDCMLSHDITIRTSDSHSIVDLNTGERINHPGNVNIGNHVWVGAYTNILKGVRINDNSVIGIHSLVVGDIPSNCIAAGIPARVIKENIDWKRELI
jgi:acetyltransferase-like isoleucine patch superfamily enzyme